MEPNRIMLKRLKVIGIVGSQGEGVFDPHQSGSGVGKDSLGEALSTVYGYKVLKFATCLRNLFYSDYGLPVEKKGVKTFEFNPVDTPYHLSNTSDFYFELVSAGLETIDPDKNVNSYMIDYASVLRAINPDYFVKEFLVRLDDLVQTTKGEELKIAITDLRQFNEWLMLRSLGGTQIHIWRAKSLRERQNLDCQLLAFNDINISNNRSLESLYDLVRGDSFRIKEKDLTCVNPEILPFIIKGYCNQYPFNSQV